MDALARLCDARFDRLRGEPGGAALCSAAAAASGALGPAAAAAAAPESSAAGAVGVGCLDEGRLWQARQDLPQVREKERERIPTHARGGPGRLRNAVEEKEGGEREGALRFYQP